MAWMLEYVEVTVPMKRRSLRLKLIVGSAVLLALSSAVSLGINVVFERVRTSQTCLYIGPAERVPVVEYQAILANKTEEQIMRCGGGMKMRVGQSEHKITSTNYRGRCSVQARVGGRVKTFHGDRMNVVTDYGPVQVPRSVPQTSIFLSET